VIACAPMRPLAAFALLGFGLACSGLTESSSAPPAPTEAAAPAEPDSSGMYTANVYGVCRKYTDCDCNLYEDMDACTTAFGEAKDVFPPEVWACVLARDCEGLCGFNAGTCFELYALQYTKGSKKGAEACPAGTLPVEVYNLRGEYVRTECKE